jgi:ribonuclease T2
MIATVLCAAVAIAALLASPAAAQCSGTTYDYLLLVQQYPGYFGSSIGYFTLHGMWPSRYGTSYPCTCTSEAFNPAQISSITNQMNSFWPSLTGSGTSQTFWDHEWTKHGTCAQDVPLLKGQFNYFNTTLGLRSRMDIMGALQSAGISPTGGSSFTAATLQKAFVNYFGVNAMLDCDNSNRVQQVSFCFTKQLNVVECDPAVKSTSINSCKTTTPIIFDPLSSGVAVAEQQ